MCDLPDATTISSWFTGINSEMPEFGLGASLPYFCLSLDHQSCRWLGKAARQIGNYVKYLSSKDMTKSNI